MRGIILTLNNLKDAIFHRIGDRDDIHVACLDFDGEGGFDRQLIMAIARWSKSYQLDGDDIPVLVLVSPFMGQLDLDDLFAAVDSSDHSIHFAADANFQCEGSELRYYLWKYYPRHTGPYYYLNPKLFITSLSVLLQLVTKIRQAYTIGESIEIDVYESYFSRFYVDSYLGIFHNHFALALDHNQNLLGSLFGRLDSLRFPYLHWMVDHFRCQNSKGGNTPLDYRREGAKLVNVKTETSPSIVILPSQSNSRRLGLLVINLFGYLKSVFQFFSVYVINGGNINKQQIFRYRKHSNSHYDQVANHFIELLEKKEPFTFAHFNDGELNFIDKYLKKDHKRTWTGRLQNQYDPQLAERLISAIQHQQNEYHVGVNCTTCGSGRRKIADNLMGEYPFKISSMVLHHNLYYLPKMLSLLRDREVFFVINEFQDLTFLSDFGIHVQEDHKVIVPFVNSYHQYDQLKDRQFPSQSVVLLMCGMLAKILNHVWYEQNPATTFIAFGSTMDDFIQRRNTKYTVYPKTLPLTRNLFGFKSFLFGPKKYCEECYHFKD